MKKNKEKVEKKEKKKIGSKNIGRTFFIWFMVLVMVISVIGAFIAPLLAR